MKRTWLGVLGLAVMLAWISPAAAQPEGVQVLRNLPYVANGHERQRLDLYLPEKADGPAAAGRLDSRRRVGRRQQRRLPRRAAGRPRAMPWPASTTG